MLYENRYRLRIVLPFWLCAGCLGVLQCAFAQSPSADLVNAVFDGNIDRTRSLLDSGADPNSKSARGESVIHIAASRGSVRLVKLLLNKAADVNVQDAYGETPLHGAAAAGSSAVINLLLRAGAEINMPSHRGVTPIMFAAAGGRVYNEDASGEREDGEGFINIDRPFGLHHLDFAAKTLSRDIAGEEALQALIKRGANVNTKSRDGFTAVWLAVLSHNLIKTRALLNAHADPDLSLKERGSVLVHTVYTNQEALVSALLAHHANPNVVDLSGQTPLGEAILFKLPNMAAILLAAGADINQPMEDIHGYFAPPLIHAIGEKDAFWTRFLLDHHASVNLPGGSVVFAALRSRSKGLIAEILDKHAVLNGLTTKQSVERSFVLDPEKHTYFTSIEEFNEPINFLSAKTTNLRTMDAEILELLLAHGANVYALSADGESALFEAAHTSSPACLTVLLRHGADPNSRNPNGVTPLMIAADYGQVENVRILLQAGAEIEARDAAKETAFSHAATHVNLTFDQKLFKERSAVRALLVEKGADINSANITGVTPLIGAVIANDLDSLRFLVEHHADRTCKDYSGKYGKTALDYAVELKRVEMIGLLR